MIHAQKPDDQPSTYTRIEAGGAEATRTPNGFSFLYQTLVHSTIRRRHA